MNKLRVFRSSFFSSILLITILSFCEIANAQESDRADWQRWGGPHGNQSTTESNWSTDWKNNPPAEVWSTNVGTGFSGVTIFENKLFTSGREGDADVILCLDADTGEENWRFSYDTPLANLQHEGGPGTTPTFHDGIVFVLSRAGIAYALDAKDGSEIWSSDLLSMTGGEKPWWGCTSSPLVIDDKVIFDAGALIALDRKSGEEVWKTPKHRSGYGSIIDFNEGSSIAVLSNDALLIVDKESGESVAEAAWVTEHPTNATTPILMDQNKFFVSTGYKRGCAVFQLVDGELVEEYTSRHMSNHMANSVLHGSFIYGINGNSHRRRTCTLVCLDVATGEKIWQERGFGCGSIVLAGDHLLILSDQGELVCAAASPDGFEQKGKVKILDGKCWTAPTFLHNRIYCRNADGDLVCWKMAEIE